MEEIVLTFKTAPCPECNGSGRVYKGLVETEVNHVYEFTDKWGNIHTELRPAYYESYDICGFCGGNKNVNYFGDQKCIYEEYDKYKQKKREENWKEIYMRVFALSQRYRY